MYRLIVQVVIYRHRCLVVFTVAAPPRASHKQVWLCGGRSVRRDGNGRCANQDSMTKNAYRQHGVTSKGDSETDCPHEPQRLQNDMPPFGVWNMTQGAYVGIEYEIPSEDDLLSHCAVPRVNLENFWRPNWMLASACFKKYSICFLAHVRLL